MPDLIREAYNSLDPAVPLQFGDPRYVDLSALHVRGSDSSFTRLLQRTIELSDSATQQLVSGFRGCGKTTELNRLAHFLRESGYRVVKVDAESLLNLNGPISVEDIWLAIAAGVDRLSSGEPDDANSPHQTGFWNRFYHFLQTEVKLESLSFKGPAELKLAFGPSLDFRARLYQELGERKSLLVSLCRNFAEESLSVDGSMARTVLIVDSLEKLRGTLSNAADVRASVERVFGAEYQELAAAFHLILTVPPWMAFTNVYAQSAFGMVRVLPMCRLTHRDTGKADETGIAAMASMIERRTDLNAIFGASAALTSIISACGGYPRGLFQLLREILLRASLNNDTLPIPENNLKLYAETVLNQYAAQFEQALSQDNLELLRVVHKEKHVRTATIDDAHRYAALFDSHFVLAYQNGQPWFDLHPLLLRLDIVQRALKAKSI